MSLFPHCARTVFILFTLSCSEHYFMSNIIAFIFLWLQETGELMYIVLPWTLSPSKHIENIGAISISFESVLLHVIQTWCSYSTVTCEVES
jgi:hypothetical protein